MTQGNDNNLLATLMQMVNENGLEAVTETFRILLNEAMKIERGQSLGAGLYERSEDRRGYANGYKPKTIDTRMGKLTISLRYLPLVFRNEPFQKSHSLLVFCTQPAMFFQPSLVFSTSLHREPY